MSQGNSARIYLREDRSESYSKKIPGVDPRLGSTYLLTYATAGTLMIQISQELERMIITRRWVGPKCPGVLSPGWFL